ncbi:adenosylcobinamide-phosphate synthase CbiB [Paenibacillus sp. GCM10027627]|uniref:adenosylcobinamide-phosphate synthase CbiB n=1 Tax=unclassified Paenibacillus TaxID=185978 RepID=UPI00363755B3
MIYSFQELLLLVAAAIAIDWIIGDPKWPTHPVIWIGRWIGWLEGKLHAGKSTVTSLKTKWLGFCLAFLTIFGSTSVMWIVVWAADSIHVWLGYAVSAWFISTTIAVKGLKEAAMLVYIPLVQGNLNEARKYVGYIVGRDTDSLTEKEAARACVETVAENTVDAFISPILFALVGGAPLAMLYRSVNTLDSMVGYRNEKYIHFGWFSARLDDALNYIPARITGVLQVIVASMLPGMNARSSWRAIGVFAKRHPSPNSGIPESAAAGALGIELGGINRYFGVESERARMGWPIRAIEANDILQTVRLLYGVSVLIFSGVIAAWFLIE